MFNFTDASSTGFGLMGDVGGSIASMGLLLVMFVVFYFVLIRPQRKKDKELKEQVEALYRSMGTSFAEAVRMFAQQSLRDGGMPFRPTIKAWDELTMQEVHEKLEKSEADIAAGRVYSQQEVDARMKGRFTIDRDQAV